MRGLFRILWLCLEKRLGRTLPVNHLLTTWLVEHLGFLPNDTAKGADGETPWARARAWASGQRLLGFGEQVF